MATTFEQSMATLAENRILAEHSNLAPYRQGFVLLDFDEAESKAFGIYRLTIGSVPCMMPIVIRDGDVSGTDTLVITDAKLFVPAVDGWINSIASLGPRAVADLIDEKDKMAKGPAQVTIRMQDFPYMLKTAEAELSKGELAALLSGMIAPKFASVEAALLAQPFLNILRESPIASYMVAKAASVDANFHDKFVSVYGYEALGRARRTASDLVPDSVLKTAEAVEVQKLTVITDIGDPLAKELKPAQKSVLLDRGQFILDNRDESEISEVYANPEALSFRTNPTAGRWDVLGADGRLVPCEIFYAHDDFAECQPASSKDVGLSQMEGDRPHYLVLPLHEKGYIRINDGRQIFCLPSKEADGSWQDHGKPATPESLRSMAESMKTGTVYGDDKVKSVSLFVCGSGYADQAYIEVNPAKPETSTCGGLPVIFTDKFRRFRRSPHCVYIPKSARLISVDSPRNTAFAPGSPSDLKAKIRADTGAEDLNINLRGTLVDISGTISHTSMSENDAVKALVFEGGVRASQAYSMVRKAVGFGGKIYGCMLKKASPDISPLDPSVIQRQTPQTTITAADMSILNEGAAGMAARVGSAPDELLSKEMLGEIEQMTDFREINAKTIRAMSDAMNEAGRLLLRIMVHRDAYEEQYGADDTEKLETAMRKRFTDNGDAVLFLREKRGASGQTGGEGLMDLLSEDMG